MQPVILWTHALAALLLGVLALAVARRPTVSLPRGPLVAALGASALWALAVAGIDARDVTTHVAESVRQVAWLALMYAILRRDLPIAGRTVSALYAVLAVVIMVVAGVAIVEAQPLQAGTHAYAAAQLALRMMGAAGALVLVRHLHLVAGPRARGGLRLAVLALGTLWSVDLVLYGTTWLAGRWPDGLVAARGLAFIALVPVLTLAAQPGAGPLQLSRTVAFQSLSVVGIGFYVALTGFVIGMVGEFGGDHARVLQTAIVFGSAAALLTIGSTPWLRAWAKVIVAKHLFAHRYDYRTEWLRFTETLGLPADGGAPLEPRIVKAIADLTDSPAGLLLVRAADALDAGAGWNWTGEAAGGASAHIVARFERTRRIVELDAVRAGTADADEAVAVPAWATAHADAWAIVPLIHLGRLAGAVVLARPPVARALDWEDFDLLGTAGRQAASYLAEDRARAALAHAERFDEFNRRFAFILHDLKNLVSQLTLVARNAERHADNPAFRADMVATLKDSSDRMTALLARLSQHGARTGEPPRPVVLRTLAERLAGARRAQHPILVTGDPAAAALADASALETLLGHLLQNAIEASTGEVPVRLIVGIDAGRATIDVVDHGTGMTPAFVRDRLFKPFDSSKPHGFGIGAFEARQLAEAMGGAVTVSSRPGEGTRFRVALPIATLATMEEAA